MDGMLIVFQALYYKERLGRGGWYRKGVSTVIVRSGFGPARREL